MNKLRQARESAGLSVAGLAAKLGMEPAAYRRYERDEVSPKVSLCREIGRYFLSRQAWPNDLHQDRDRQRKIKIFGWAKRLSRLDHFNPSTIHQQKNPVGQLPWCR